MKTLQNGSPNPHQACKPGDETANKGNGLEIFSASILRRAIAYRPANEDAIRGFESARVPHYPCPPVIEVA